MKLTARQKGRQPKTKTSLRSSQGLLKPTPLSKINLIVFVLVFAAIGGYVLYRSFAAGPTANIWVSTTGSDTTCTRSASSIADPGGAADCATINQAAAISHAGDNI